MIDADAEGDAPFRRDVLVALDHAALHRDGALDRIDDAGELDQRAVAHELDDTTVAGGDLAIDEVIPMGLQRRQGAGLVLLHEAAVADHVGGQYGGKPAFQVLSPSPKRLTTKGKRIHAVGIAWLVLAKPRQFRRCARTSALHPIRDVKVETSGLASLSSAYTNLRQLKFRATSRDIRF